ncbi:MAG: hypothetical protein AAF532_16820 [Planctomycetota bacterium]
MTITPLLADGFGTLISLVVFAVGFIGWISQIVNASKQQQQPQAGRPAGRPQGRPVAQGGGKAAGGDPLRNEIEAFLREVQQKTGGEPAPPPEPRREELVDADVEFVDEPAEPTPRRDPQPARPTPVGGLSERHLESTLSERHLPEMRPKRASKREKKIDREVDRRVAERQKELLEANRATERKLADAEAALSDLRTRGPAAAGGPRGIRAMLADPQSVRDSIVVAEILERPKRGV